MSKCQLCGNEHDESLLVTLETIEDNGHVYTVCEECASKYFCRSVVSGHWVYWPEYRTHVENNYWHLRRRLTHLGLFMTAHEASIGYRWCELCGLPDSDIRTVNDPHNGAYDVCEDCFNYNYTDYVKCEDCGQWFPDDTDMYETHDGYVICEECRGNWRRCYECGDLYHEDDDRLRYSERIDEHVCDNCWDDSRHEYHDSDDLQYQHDYGYKPEGVFHDTDEDPDGATLYFGTENEHSHDDSEELYDHHEYIFKNYDPAGTKREGHFYQKSDSSLDYGTEVVSHPMSLSYWHKIRGHMENVFRGSRRFTESGCDGLHVHLSRNGMSQAHEDRFVLFFEMCKPSICTVARRESDDYAAFMNDDMYDEATAYGTLDAMMNVISRVRDHRYRCVNFENSRTVEVRVFRSTLNVDEYYSALEFCHAAYQFTKAHDIQDIYEWGKTLALWDCFLNFCADDRRYDTLMCWLEKISGDREEFGMGSELFMGDWPDAVLPKFDDIDNFLSHPLPITGGMALARIIGTNENGVPYDNEYEDYPQPASIRQQQMERELASQMSFDWNWSDIRGVCRIMYRAA